MPESATDPDGTGTTVDPTLGDGSPHDNGRIHERLRAVERAITGEGRAVADLSDGAAADAEREALDARIDELESRVEELEAGTQAVRGYVGSVRAVNREVERRADLALATATEARAVVSGDDHRPNTSGEADPEPADVAAVPDGRPRGGSGGIEYVLESDPDDPSAIHNGDTTYDAPDDGTSGTCTPGTDTPDDGTSGTCTPGTDTPGCDADDTVLDGAPHDRSDPGRSSQSSHVDTADSSLGSGALSRLREVI